MARRMRVPMMWSEPMTWSLALMAVWLLAALVLWCLPRAALRTRLVVLLATGIPLLGVSTYICGPLVGAAGLVLGTAVLLAFSRASL